METAFSALLIACIVYSTQTNAQCTTESITTSNFVNQPWTSMYIKLDDTSGIVSAGLANYRPEEHLKFYYETKFHDCGTSSVYISVKNLNMFNGRQYYMANTQVGSPVDAVDVLLDTDAPFLSFTDSRLFKYTGGFAVDITAMESKSQYVTRDNSNALIYANNQVFWVTWPYITRTVNFTTTLTYFRAAFQINGKNASAYVYFSSPNCMALISSESSHFNRLTDQELLFEVITWRFYKGFATNGSVIHGGAMVLRKPNDSRYITIDVNEGQIDLPQTHCFYKYIYIYSRWYRYRQCFNYQTVKYRYYDQTSRSVNSTFEQANIREQNSVDERFFEAIDDFDGTHKMRSALDPRRYMAILRVADDYYKLVVMELRDDVDGLVNYKFDVLVPPLAAEVRAVPRLPCNPDTPREDWLYSCL